MRHILLIVLLCIPLWALSQSKDQNYVMSKIMLDTIGENKIPSIQYYDGLGYPTVSVVTTGGDGKTAYSLTTYDDKRREQSRYLPVATDKSLLYKSPEEISGISNTFYNNDNFAFSQNHYDALDRIVSVDIPGKQWQENNKGTKNIFSTNTAGDKVLHYEAPLNQNTLVKPEETKYIYYPAGTLTKETTYDADSSKLTVFKNLHGNKVLERRDIGDTYFVYDDLGQLRFVLSPMYQSSPFKAIYGYEYRYDNRGRMVKKILPGCEYIQYWYDKENHLTFMQDDNLRKQGKFRFLLYDYLGRLAVQGICSGCKRDENMLPVVTYYQNKPGLLGTEYVLGNDYSNLLTNPTIELVKYYDNYNFLNGLRKNEFSDLTVNTSVIATGYQTGSVVLATNGESVYSVIVYDIKGNIVETKTKELNGFTEHITNSYSFTNNMKTSVAEVNVKYGEAFKTTTTNEYNQFNNKIEFCQTSVLHGGHEQVFTISYAYDDLGRLEWVTRPFGTGDNGKVKYEYDLHGWTKNITTNSFKEQLYYADGLGTPCYNGNISSMKWQNTGYDQIRGYKFSYDKLNRLTNAVYGEREGLDNRTDRYNEYLEYDINGNITRLQRRGKKQDGEYGKIDNLHLNYSGNHLYHVQEDAENILYVGSFDYKVSGSYDKFGYNGSGSLVSDGSKGIALIDYDNNNMPCRIQFTNGNVTKYVYTATGQKLRTIHYTAVSNIKVAIGQTHNLTANEIQYADSTDYLMGGNLVLTNGIIDKYLFPGGYCQAHKTGRCIALPIRPSGTDSAAIAQYEALMSRWRQMVAAEQKKDNFNTYYFNQDHLGNNREVVDASGNIEQVTNYYPFGTPYCDSVSTKGSDLQHYKYNGKELDKMHGLDTYDYGARQYNPILSIWDRMDPLCEKYYNVSPYTYCMNNPMNAVDPDGEDVLIFFTDKNGNSASFLFSGFHGVNQIKVPNNQYVLDFIDAYLYNAKNGGGDNLIQIVTNHDYMVEVVQPDDHETEYQSGSTPVVYWESRQGLETTDGGTQSAATSLEHEFDHTLDDLTNHKKHVERRETDDQQYENKEERRVITGSEAKTAKANHESIRKNHKGKYYQTTSPTSVKPIKRK